MKFIFKTDDSEYNWLNGLKCSLKERHSRCEMCESGWKVVEFKTRTVKDEMHALDSELTEVRK